jgi:hypothetical protein
VYSFSPNHAGEIPDDLRAIVEQHILSQQELARVTSVAIDSEQKSRGLSQPSFSQFDLALGAQKPGPDSEIQNPFEIARKIVRVKS